MGAAEVWELLALKKPLGNVELSKKITAGLSVRALLRVKDALNLSDVEFGDLLGVSAKTISRLRDKRRMTAAVGDRLYRLARIYRFASHVLEDTDNARNWLQTPQPGLGNVRPVELLKTEAGAREVEDLLGRIEYGVVA